MDEALLKVENVEIRFGGIVALQGVSFQARRGDITAVIGPNGAGKTTMFNCITGMYRPSGGRILFQDQDVTRMSPFRIAQRGIARTFQNLALFQDLTVFENLKMGAYRHGGTGLLEGAILSPRARREEAEVERRALETLEFLGISAVAEKKPTELSYGVQKRVEFARALMQNASLILLDEPMAGMNQGEKTDLVQLILSIRDRLGVSFLLVEHDMPVVMGLSDHIIVLNFGRKIAEGLPEEIRKDEEVIAAYLGSDGADQAA
jgi:branched-chain amino acid transport system ATP-binding protein